MGRKFKSWIAIAGLVAVGGILAYGFSGPLSFLGNLGVGVGVEGPPDMPVEWYGRVDYEKLDGDLTSLSKRPEMAGLAVAVVEDGELRFVRAYGMADRLTGAPVTLNTIFRWASVSKTVTGTLAAKLAQAGALDLDRPVASWNTSLRLPGAAEQRITFAQLLAQQSGLPKNAYDDKVEADHAPATIRTSFSMVPLKCQPGTCHSYQNVAFDTASEVFARATGRPMEGAVQSNLFRPLGMASADYGMAALTGAKDWARPHEDGEVRKLREAYWRLPAAAGVSSNILDFAKWMQATMGARADVLPPAMLKTAHTPRVATDPLYGGALKAAISDAHYGLGWRSFSYGGLRLAGHSGSVDGYRATMIFEPATRTGVVALWNSNWGAPFRIPFAVIDSYHKRTDHDWLSPANIPVPPPEPVDPSKS